MSLEWKLQHLTYKYVREQRYEVALLPIGSTEPHGLHMPYGSDALQSELIAGRVCERANQMGARAVLLPTIPYGVNTNMLHFPLAINLHQSTLNQVVLDIVHSLEQQGLRKLLLFNGHGGNDFKPLVRDLHGKTSVFLVIVNWWLVGLDRVEDIFESLGDHAGEMETSVGLALFGDLVHPEDADDGAVRPFRFEALNEGWASIARPWHRLTKNTTSGDPRPATREKGERYLELVVDRLSRFVKELSDASLDEDELFPFVDTFVRC